jgi:hypothetical protein
MRLADSGKYLIFRKRFKNSLFARTLKYFLRMPLNMLNGQRKINHKKGFAEDFRTSRRIPKADRTAP